MYRCNLSFRQLNTYLDFLIERKLIKSLRIGGEAGDSRIYQTTNRGKAFIQAYNSIRVLISTTELETDE
jgi:predicted transcriptional regulator